MKILITCSQIILVPIYTVFKFLSLIIDAFLWCGEKVLDALSWIFKPASKGISLLKAKIGAYRAHKKAESTAAKEEKRKHHAENAVLNDGKNKGLKKFGIIALKVLVLLILSPFIVIIFACMIVYAILSFIWSLVCRLFTMIFGEGTGVRKEKDELSDRPEKAWRRNLRWKMYSIKLNVSAYFNKYIFVFKAKDRGELTRKKQDTRFIALMLLFPLLQFLVFWVYVNYRSILLAFQLEVDGEIIWTFSNFQRFFLEIKASSTMWLYIRNSLSFFPVSVCITLPLSFISSYFLFKKVPLASFYRVVYYLPSIMSSVAWTMLFRYIVAFDGPLSVVENWLGIEPIKFLGTEQWAMPTILFYTVWSGMGYNMVLLSSSMSRIPTELFESAKIDGAGILREMFNIVLPLVWGTLSTLITLSLAHLFTNIGPVILLTNGQHNTNTVASYIYYQVKSASENAYAYGSAVGLVFTIIGLPIVLGGRWILGKISDNIEL